MEETLQFLSDYNLQQVLLVKRGSSLHPFKKIKSKAKNTVDKETLCIKGEYFVAKERSAFLKVHFSLFV